MMSGSLSTGYLLCDWRLLLALAFSLNAVCLRAQTIRISAGLGYHKQLLTGDASPAAAFLPGDFEALSTFEAGFSSVVRLGADLAGPFGIEAGVVRVRGRLRNVVRSVGSESSYTPYDASGPSTLMGFLIRGVLTLHASRVEPFLSAGLVLVSLSKSAEVDVGGGPFVTSTLGAGMRWKASPRLAVVMGIDALFIRLRTVLRDTCCDTFDERAQLAVELIPTAGVELSVW